MKFELKSKFKPTGDQPEAIKRLIKNIKNGVKNQVLLGVTGSGKTFTLANVIQKIQKPTLIISPNKTLAAQLYQEFKEFFPDNAVHYFVSYYDYYQPEAYIPHTDTYIEKDAKINEEIDRLRHAAVQDVTARKDVIVVASVSCIYNIGSPENYEGVVLQIKKDQKISRKNFILNLTSLQYQRNDIEFKPGTFRVRGNIIEIYIVTGEKILRVEISEDKIEKISELSPNMDKTLKKDFSVLDDIYGRRFGIWGGLTFQQIQEKYPELYQNYQQDPLNFQLEGLEKSDDVNKRVKKTIDFLLKNNPEKKILIITHAGVIKSAVGQALCIPDENHEKVCIPTSTATKIDYFSKYVKIIYQENPDSL